MRFNTGAADLGSREPPTTPVSRSLRWTGPGSLIAALVLLPCVGAQAQTVLDHWHLSDGIENLSFLDSGGPAPIFGLFDATVRNASGSDWSAYTFNLPDVVAGMTGNFVAATLTGGGFNAVSVSTDERYLGLWGGTVANGASFSVLMKLNYQQQWLTGAPTFVAAVPPLEPTYEAPPVYIDPPTDWSVVEVDPGFPGSVPPVPDPPADFSYLVSSTTCENGTCTDRIVAYDKDGHYDVVENGVLVGGGTFSGDTGQLDDWAHKYTSGGTNQTSPAPEPETWWLMLGGLGLLGVARRTRR
jgi:hypothetical protein